MNRNRNGSKRQAETMHTWTYEQARHAAPYIASVMASLREHWLDLQFHDRKVQKLKNQPGRPDRAALLDQDDALRLARAATDRFEDAQSELNVLDVFCIDPVKGEAVIPFTFDNQLAWFVFDLFDADHLRHWRYHSDPLDTRRPIAEVLEGQGETLIA